MISYCLIYIWYYINGCNFFFISEVLMLGYGIGGVDCKCIVGSFGGWEEMGEVERMIGSGREMEVYGWLICRGGLVECLRIFGRKIYCFYVW